ncbi:outer membrane murein-binding lipoprotein Lpp [Clostridium saccharoperbutylacetonicum]|uniref:Uncharacterized protein n=1 Tax=Clostridium saccharoperbutylacetonicum N1-4(HMT) TaxID=931276 RepID=M1MP24_9CLOT|nr:hypothetical protein [Clostridium saccharoperbutylacetonicum]AGF59609.1 hypothetical protein Cspa_135p00490 [Clostridium saccharoperbutylacetonicum N1-4(HMT)]NRT64534.1 outer membrane murein-binding lipoprotein Lpp [Clostridium saccharoperbutylacetonicum]NSB29009.1 outer membrane murein-binding lipoprotein Lpp [Clostridium saccharoperbutylacetonicum]NSB46224.1 outer membrane murein-binding lipoprotein Lpp [Clostridium saccharoperbutylacetonicum]
MKKYLDNSGLTYYSTKLYDYLKNKLTALNSKISNLEVKVDSDNKELITKIENNNQSINQNTSDIKTANSNISNLSIKVDNNYDELKADFNSADMRPTGDSIFINNVEQFVFKDIGAGETVTIPNSGDGSDFLIECFVKTETGTPLVHKSLNINTSTKDLLEYDDRYVEITDYGAKPKDNVTLDLTLQGTIGEYNIYTTDLLPVELVDSINNLTDYKLS